MTPKAEKYPNFTKQTIDNKRFLAMFPQKNISGYKIIRIFARYIYKYEDN